MAEMAIEDAEPVAHTPGLSHLWIFKALDQTGLSPWLLGFGCFLVLAIAAITMLIMVGYPDPTMYRNSIAFTAIISFFLVFYMAMGRGWYTDMLAFLDFDSRLAEHLKIVEPSRRVVYGELVFAALCAFINININDNILWSYSPAMSLSVSFFYFLEYVLIIFAADVILRQLVCLTRVAQNIRIDLLNADIYSTLANIMVRTVGLYITGVCIIALSYIVFTEGSLSFMGMLVLMMPWYLPGLIIILSYIVPYSQFRRRIRSAKHQELNCVAAALNGQYDALEHSLLKGEVGLSKIDLLYYQERVQAIREWPFTDRIRSLVLFGILPPMTWVIAALIEISIESSL